MMTAALLSRLAGCAPPLADYSAEQTGLAGCAPPPLPGGAVPLPAIPDPMLFLEASAWLLLSPSLRGERGMGAWGCAL